ncbi:FAD-binding oxidoreductase [Streptomyces sp. NPDC001070]
MTTNTYKDTRITPGDAAYDAERSGFQTAQRHRPDLIVAAGSAEDVRAAVAHAAARGLPVAVQATGHGLSVAADRGALISTRRMRAVRVDPAARTAHVAAGARWAEVIAAAAPFGLAPPSGSSPDVGAVGYTLGGGLGLTARQYGWACDHVRAFDVVTADGRARHVTARTEPELFWALRGGGHGLCVVTGMEIGLLPVASLYGGQLVFPAEATESVLEAYLRWTEDVPEELTSSVALVPAGPGGRHLASVRIAFNGPAAEGERLVAPLRATGPRTADVLRLMPYAESGAVHRDPSQPHAYAADNAVLRDVDAAALRRVLAAAAGTVVDLRHLGGALARPPAVPGATGHRDGRFLLRVISAAGPDMEPVRAVQRGVLAEVAGRTAGRCLTFVYGDGAGATPAQFSSGHPAPDLDRLTRLKAALDPGDLFRFNRGVRPAGQPATRKPNAV